MQVVRRGVNTEVAHDPRHKVTSCFTKKQPRERSSSGSINNARRGHVHEKNNRVGVNAPDGEP